jgi:transcriptional regulator with XRE-family HTH domain
MRNTLKTKDKAAMSKPQKFRDRTAMDLEVCIGLEVRAFRQQSQKTVSDLANATGLSMGMVSKIENGNISASLTTLQTLASALQVPVTLFFRRFEERREAVHMPAGTAPTGPQQALEAGLRMISLAQLGPNGSGVVMAPREITLARIPEPPGTNQHRGLELLYMLAGELRYRHGDSGFHLRPGDTLLFDGDAPHWPEDLIAGPARYLSIIAHRQPA